jgi:hypothetical protein
LPLVAGCSRRTAPSIKKPAETLVGLSPSTWTPSAVKRESRAGSRLPSATQQTKLLILDEPTSGIDVNAKEDMRRIIRKAAGEGLGVVLNARLGRVAHGPAHQDRRGRVQRPDRHAAQDSLAAGGGANGRPSGIGR